MCNRNVILLLVGSFSLVVLADSAWAQGGGTSIAQDILGTTEAAAPELEVTPEEPPELGSIATDIDEFFEREPLGFSLRTIQVAWEDTLAASQTVADQLGAWWDDPDRLWFILAVFGGILVLALAWYLDRRYRRLVDSVSERVRVPGPELLARALALLVRIAGALLVPVVLLAVNFLVLRRVLAGERWPVLVQDLLVLWIIFRAAVRLARELLKSEVVEAEEVHVTRARRALIGFIWVVIGFQAAQTVLADLDYRSEVVALVDFARRAIITLLIFYLLALKDSVLCFLPESGPAAYRRVREFLSKYYALVLILTGLLGLMWTFGYRRAAVAIVGRGYLSLAIIIVASLVLRRVQHQMERGDDQDREKVRLAQSVWSSAGRYIKFFSGLLVLVLFLKLIGLYGLFISLADYPLVAIGGLEVSVLLVFRAILIFLIFVLVSRVAKPLLQRRLFERLDVEEGVAFAITTVMHYVMLVIGLIAATLSTGIDLGALGWFAGALGVGIGFGLQEFVRDIVSGFVLLFGRAVTKGDIITAGEHYGEVRAVSARSVTIRTPDNIELLVPTSSVIHNTIVNWTKTNPFVRLHVGVGVSYSADPSVVKETLLEAASGFEPALEQPAPMVWLTGFGDSSVDFELLLWFNARRFTRNRILGELYFIIWDKLHEKGIEIPFPQRDLHVKSIHGELKSFLGLGQGPKQGETPDGADEHKAPKSPAESSEREARGR